MYRIDGRFNDLDFRRVVSMSSDEPFLAGMPRVVIRYGSYKGLAEERRDASLISRQSSLPATSSRVYRGTAFRRESFYLDIESNCFRFRLIAGKKNALSRVLSSVSWGAFDDAARDRRASRPIRSRRPGSAWNDCRARLLPQGRAFKRRAAPRPARRPRRRRPPRRVSTLHEFL